MPVATSAGISSFAMPLDFERMHGYCRRLPPFPPLASQLIELFSRPDGDLLHAVGLIRSDAVFSGELLRIANSAEFASYEPLEDVSRAVLYLGFERVQSVIRRITYCRLMKDSFKHPFTAEIHRNNLATAFICEKLMKGYGEPNDLEEFCPYSVGLYLKIGALVLLRAFPRDYPRFLCTRIQPQEALLEAETKLFGFNHAVISQYLVKHWEFPEAFQTMVLRHSAPPEGCETLDTLNAARLASQLAGSLGFSFMKALPYPSAEETLALLPKSQKAEMPPDASLWKEQIGAHIEELSFHR